MTHNESILEEPRTLHPDAVRILPLGGLGEIGLNMMVIEVSGKLLIIDCGLMFPEAYMLGIDLVIPDVSAIASRKEDIVGIVLTHGHEDHIGALPFLLVFFVLVILVPVIHGHFL